MSQMDPRRRRGQEVGMVCIPVVWRMVWRMLYQNHGFA